MQIKLKGSEVSIATANSVANSSTVRVVNIGAAAVVNLAYANGLVYANTTVSNTESIVIVKGPTDKLTGSASMTAAPVEYRG